MLLESPSEFLHFALTWPGFDSRTRDSFTTSPTEPSVVHVCTITSPEIHLTPQSRSSHPYSCHHWCTRNFPCQRPWPISCTNTQRPYQKATVVLFTAIALGPMSLLSVLLVDVIRCFNSLSRCLLLLAVASISSLVCTLQTWIELRIVLRLVFRRH